MLCIPSNKYWNYGGTNSAMLPINTNIGLIKLTLDESNCSSALSNPTLKKFLTVFSIVLFSVYLTQRLLIANSVVCVNE